MTTFFREDSVTSFSLPLLNAEVLWPVSSHCIKCAEQKHLPASGMELAFLEQCVHSQTPALPRVNCAKLLPLRFPAAAVIVRKCPVVVLSNPVVVEWGGEGRVLQPSCLSCNCGIFFFFPFPTWVDWGFCRNIIWWCMAWGLHCNTCARTEQVFWKKKKGILG